MGPPRTNETLGMTTASFQDTKKIVPVFFFRFRSFTLRNVLLPHTTIIVQPPPESKLLKYS